MPRSSGFWVAVIGTVMTTLAILSGTSTVLYTFYPPLEAHPTFYVGATLLIIGSWVWCGVMIGSYRAWRAGHRDERVPLALHGMLTTVAIWILATAGLAVEHGAFLVGQLHGGLPPGAVAVWRAPVSQGLRPWCRGVS